jgi:hypothetical protein
MNRSINLRVPQNAGNFLTSQRPISYSRRTLLQAVSQYQIIVAFLISTSDSNVVKRSDQMFSMLEHTELDHFQHIVYHITHLKALLNL